MVSIPTCFTVRWQLLEVSSLNLVRNKYISLVLLCFNLISQSYLIIEILEKFPGLSCAYLGGYHPNEILDILRCYHESLMIGQINLMIDAHEVLDIRIVVVNMTSYGDASTTLD